MSTLREAAQQALEAMLNFPGDISDEMFESIRSLKAALAEPVQEPPYIFYVCPQCHWTLNKQEPLTEDEIALLSVECAASSQHDDIHFARAIEAAHGIGSKT